NRRVLVEGRIDARAQVVELGAGPNEWDGDEIQQLGRGYRHRAVLRPQGDMRREEPPRRNGSALIVAVQRIEIAIEGKRALVQRGETAAAAGEFGRGVRAQQADEVGGRFVS